MAVGAGGSVSERRARGPSIALAKGNQLFKLLVENLDVSLKIVSLTSAAVSDMGSARGRWETKKKRRNSPPPSANEMK